MNDTSNLFRNQTLRELWLQFLGSRTDEPNLPFEERLNKVSSRFFLAAIAIILAIVIGLVSWMIYRRSEQGMSELLEEKGAALLNVFEGALRTGMAGESGLHLQTLLNEMARNEDIEFVAVTMPDGTVIAHSDKGRIGESFQMEDGPANLARMGELAPETSEKSVAGTFEGRRVFLIYRHFTMGRKDWDKSVPEPVIFLGLEVSPFEITNSQNRSYVTILAVVTMLVVLCGLVALSLAQRAVESRRKQRRAEREVLRLEEEVRRNEKLAAVGTLAAGVAHEIRNPLSSIKGYATYFSQKFPEGSEDREAAGIMVKEVNRLNRVITDLLGLSRPDATKLKLMDIKLVVEHVIHLLRHTASKKNVRIEVHYAPRKALIMGDVERLSQALLNICLNAIEAMPEGGRLEIAVAVGRKRLCLMTRDNGAGIAMEIQSQIFDPYFTTKNSGTGLGLPMAHKIMRAHKGEIEVYSVVAANGRPGCTIFRLWLPLAGDRPEK